MVEKVLREVWSFRHNTGCDRQTDRHVAVAYTALTTSRGLKQEAQLMLTTGSTRLAVRRGQQTWYFGSIANFR